MLLSNSNVHMIVMDDSVELNFAVLTYNFSVGVIVGMAELAMTVAKVLAA